MEDKEYVPELAAQYYTKYSTNMLPENHEIVEVVEVVEENHSSKSFKSSGRSVDHNSDNSIVAGLNDDVYVAVGKDDLDVVKWALDHVVSPGARLYLVHIFPPITYIPTPVGKLARSHLTEDQVRFYIEEEENRRRNILLKYILLCNDAKVNVETVLIEHDATAKAIVDLIPIHNITNLVMGIKKPSTSRILRSKMTKGEYVKKSAPESCEVTIVHDGKKVSHIEKFVRFVQSSPRRSSSEHVRRRSHKNLYLCACFSACMR